MVKLIAHVLVHSGDDYLLIQRSEIKRGQPNVYPCLLYTSPSPRDA